jgi:hypothetical protein
MQTQSDLYFMLNPALGIIKIGITGDVQGRRQSLECACGVPLDVLRVVRSAERFERDLHLAFDTTRLCGEWFAPTEALVALAYGEEPIADFLARSSTVIEEAQRAREAAAEARRAESAEATRVGREEAARLKAEQKRAAAAREAKRRARIEREAERKRAAITANQAAWSASDAAALKERVISAPRAVEATGRQQFIESQRSRNAVLNGVKAVGHA